MSCFETDTKTRQCLNDLLDSNQCLLNSEAKKIYINNKKPAKISLNSNGFFLPDNFLDKWNSETKQMYANKFNNAQSAHLCNRYLLLLKL